MKREGSVGVQPADFSVGVQGEIRGVEELQEGKTSKPEVKFGAKNDSSSAPRENVTGWVWGREICCTR